MVEKNRFIVYASCQEDIFSGSAWFKCAMVDYAAVRVLWFSCRLSFQENTNDLLVDVVSSSCIGNGMCVYLYLCLHMCVCVSCFQVLKEKEREELNLLVWWKVNHMWKVKLWESFEYCKKFIQYDADLLHFTGENIFNYICLSTFLNLISGMYLPVPLKSPRKPYIWLNMIDCSVMTVIWMLDVWD